MNKAKAGSVKRRTHRSHRKPQKLQEEVKAFLDRERIFEPRPAPLSPANTVKAYLDEDSIFQGCLVRATPIRTAKKASQELARLPRSPIYKDLPTLLRSKPSLSDRKIWDTLYATS